MTVFGQWAGNAVLRYFQSAVLGTTGITEDREKPNPNLANNFQQFFFAILGAALVDRVGRRPLLLFANAACRLVWVGMSISPGVFDEPREKNKIAGESFIFIFFLGTIYSLGFTPLQAHFPVEVLSFEMRPKGMAFSQLAVNAAGLLNQLLGPLRWTRLVGRILS